MSNSNYSIGLQHLKRVHTAYCAFSLPPETETRPRRWQFFSTRDRDETLVLETVSRPRRRDRDHAQPWVFSPVFNTRCQITRRVGTNMRWQSQEGSSGQQTPSSPTAVERQSESPLRQGRFAGGSIHVDEVRQQVAVSVRGRSRSRCANASVRRAVRHRGRRRVQLAQQRRQRVRVRRRASTAAVAAASSSVGVSPPVAVTPLHGNDQQQQRVRSSRSAVDHARSRDRMFTGLPTVRRRQAACRRWQ